VICCPRCGYDLSGIRTPEATRGTCSECGLEFSWAELESGRLHFPSFSFEHARGWLPIAFLRTAARSITGWRLWGPLRMEHPIRVGRLILFVVLLGAAFHFLSVAGTITAACSPGVYLYGWQPKSWSMVTYTANGARIVSPSPPGSIVLWHDRGLPVVLDDVVPLVVWPYRARISRTTSGVGFSMLDGVALAGGMAPALGTPLVFLMLRQTRRQFKLRKLHLFRAVLLSGPAVLTTMMIGSLITAIGGGIARWPWNGPNVPVIIAAGSACFAYTTFWWWTFGNRYLKAPHALGIAVCGVIIGGLLFALFSLATGTLLYSLLV
jgi:hypothetical protein